MIRQILYGLLLFLTPFVLYVLYLRLMPAHAAARGPRWRKTAVTALLLAGLTLGIGGYLYAARNPGTIGKGTYVPPREENGTIVPGHFEEADRTP